jgi:ATP/maltotriose-dependent transcriptional regulator MalT
LQILQRVDAAGQDAHDKGNAAPSLLFPRRQVIAHHAGVLLESGRLDEAALVIERALQTPAEDVRSSVVALRVLANVRMAQGRRDEAVEAIDLASVTARESSYGTEARLVDELRERLQLT